MSTYILLSLYCIHECKQYGAISNYCHGGITPKWAGMQIILNDTQITYQPAHLHLICANN